MKMNITKLLRIDDPTEEPLEALLPDGGFSAIFRTVGCVGDSLSSGELESLNESGQKGYHDYYEHSWGQYIARTNGCKVYNFSRGGMTAKEYCDSFAQSKDFWNADKACQAYIIALGVNDVTRNGSNLGDVETDVDLGNWRNNAPTVVGYYAQIVQRLLENQPKARFFFVTPPVSTSEDENRAKAYDHLSDLLYQLAAKFEYAYVIDLRRYGPVYDEDFRRAFYLGGHLSTAGYLLTAKLVMTYIDYLIRHNMDDFRQCGFIGKGGIHHIGYKW